MFFIIVDASAFRILSAFVFVIVVVVVCCMFVVDDVLMFNKLYVILIFLLCGNVMDCIEGRLLLCVDTRLVTARLNVIARVIFVFVFKFLFVNVNVRGML